MKVSRHAASHQSRGKGRGLLEQFKQGQTLLKAHGVQGVESQRCCELAEVKIHKGVGYQPALAMGIWLFLLSCANLNPTRLGQAMAREQTRETGRGVAM